MRAHGALTRKRHLNVPVLVCLVADDFANAIALVVVVRVLRECVLRSILGGALRIGWPVFVRARHLRGNGATCEDMYGEGRVRDVRRAHRMSELVRPRMSDRSI